MNQALSDLPTDAFTEILLRLPPSARRRFRLVCRHWRDVIDERTPEKQSRATALVFAAGYLDSAACVIDGLPEGRCREIWASDPASYRATKIVGTCNGLLCLCDNGKPEAAYYGGITLVNPATGETLAVPPLPDTGLQTAWWPETGPGHSWHTTYSFGYHPTTGQYKIVHVPTYYQTRYGGQPAGEFDAVHVFTLGKKASWRAVPIRRSSIFLYGGLISVDGAMYWVTKDTDMVVSFDLRDERVTSTRRLPAPVGPHDRVQLTEVHGRMGVAISTESMRPRHPHTHIEVWVEGSGGGGGRRQGWSRRYSVWVLGVMWRTLTQPYFAHGEHILTYGGENVVLANRLSSDGDAGGGRRPSQFRVATICETRPGVLAATVDGRSAAPTSAPSPTSRPPNR